MFKVSRRIPHMFEHLLARMKLIFCPSFCQFARGIHLVCAPRQAALRSSCCPQDSRCSGTEWINVLLMGRRSIHRRYYCQLRCGCGRHVQFGAGHPVQERTPPHHVAYAAKGAPRHKWRGDVVGFGSWTFGIPYNCHIFYAILASLQRINRFEARRW